MALGEVGFNADMLAPEDGQRVSPGPLELTGYAFAGGEREVARVDLYIDAGNSWT
jgi:sulfite oxidase